MQKHSNEPELPAAESLRNNGDNAGGERRRTPRGIGKAGKPPASEAMPEGHPLAGLRVVIDSETDEQHERRRKRLLREAADADARSVSNPREKAHWESEAIRLRGLAGSAVWHAEADAADAGYSENTQVIGRAGRFYVVAENPATGDRLAWKAGAYRSRADLPQG